LALYDRIRSCPKHITIIGTGLVASMAFMVYVAGDKRLCTSTVRFLNHQTKAGFDSEMTEAQLKIEAVETKKMEAECVDLIAERTFLTSKIIRGHIKLGDKYISAKEAINMGIAHEIIPEIEKKEIGK
jgi:ATP-dependent protease ClpP protease subunit